MVEIVVREGMDGPVEECLKLLFPFARRGTLEGVVRGRDIRRGGERLRRGDRVARGDILRVYADLGALAPPPHVLRREGSLLAVEKPARLPSTGEGSMEEWVGLSHPGARACHRLDAQTCGVLLFALDDAAFEAATDAFRQGAVRKTYRCLVCGRPREREGELACYLVKDAARGIVRAQDRPGGGAKRAELRYRLLEEREGVSLLEVDLLTGRTHQIRVQMARAGHPILGDDRYGDRECNRLYKARRLYLQAVRAEILRGAFAGFFAESEPLEALVAGCGTKGETPLDS